MKIAVIGGGMAGLTCGLLLRDRGHEVVVLDQGTVVGGKVRSERVGAWQIEHGPPGVLDNAPDTLALVKRLGLVPLVSDDASRRRYLVRDGRLREVPDSPPKLLLSTTLTLAEKWALVREPRAAAAPAGVDETVAEMAHRRLGASLAERFVEPVASGVYAGDYRRLSVASAFPRLAELERTHGSLLKGLIAMKRPASPARLVTFAGGMGALPLALAQALGDAVRTGVTVEALDRTPAGGYRVATSSGPLEADRVVLALPADDAARLTASLDGALADAFSAIPIAGIVAVSLGYPRSAVRHSLDGFGFLVPRREGHRVLGAIWMTSTFPALAQAPAGHVMLRCMIGGRTDAEAAGLPEARLVDIAREALEVLMGITAEPAFSHVLSWPRGIAQYEVGHAARVATIEARSTALGLDATGAALRGVGVNDVIREATALAARIPA